MTRLIILTASALGLAACAASGPETVASANADSAATLETNAAANNASSGEEEFLEVVEVPAVPQTATVQKQSDELVCWRERLTGSNRLERICRYKSEIEATREESQRAMKRLTRRADPGQVSD